MMEGLLEPSGVALVMFFFPGSLRIETSAVRNLTPYFSVMLSRTCTRLHDLHFMNRAT